MRRFMACLLLLCIWLPSAGAESFPCPYCLHSHEITYLQMDDTGIAVEGLCNALVAAGYLPAGTQLATFNDRMYDALCHFQADHDLPLTGQADGETLSLLLHGMSSEESRLVYSIYPDLPFFVPTDGGQRVHIKACCSDMNEPRAISLQDALAMHIEPCGKCARKYRKYINWSD